MERAEGDRRQLCESVAQHMRGLEVHLEFNTSWGQDQCIYPLSVLFVSSHRVSVGGYLKATVSHGQGAAAIKNLGFGCVGRY